LTPGTQAENDPYKLLVCTDHLESGNGFDLLQRALQDHPGLHAVIRAQADAIPAECVEASWLEAVVALFVWPRAHPLRV